MGFNRAGRGSGQTHVRGGSVQGAGAVQGFERETRARVLECGVSWCRLGAGRHKRWGRGVEGERDAGRVTSAGAVCRMHAQCGGQEAGRGRAC